MPTPLEKFQALLRELLQFDCADLDFGVYRIMNLRRERLERWLTVDFPARTRQILQGAAPTFDDDLAARLEGLRVTLRAVDPNAIDDDGNLVSEALRSVPAGQEYARLFAQQRRAPIRPTADLEPLIYNHLYEFFSRYYDTGDFIPKRRRSFAPDGRDTYAVPWDGEEVVLHWANKDQYYVKTGERFTHYRWQSRAADRAFTIEFRLTEADLPAANNKDGAKKFHLPLEDRIEWNDEASLLLVPFHYRSLASDEERAIGGSQQATIRDNISSRTVDRLRAHPVVGGVPHLETALMAPKKDAGGNDVQNKSGHPIPLLRHHLNRWAMKNEADFFIHKNLRRFLSGELDYFIKSVVLNLDNLLAAGELRADPNFRLLEAVKKLGGEIVDFLAQLEDFQKALFEKKKFVVETHWCLTLDRIPAAVKDEAYAAILANDRQWEAWEKLFRVSAWPRDLATTEPRTREFLDVFSHMMIDTSLGYNGAFVDNLIAEIENIDGDMDGLIIQSENFQALNLLQESFLEGVSSIYIDPPYNTDAGPISYKNGYRSSSWVTMISQALAASRRLLTTRGVLCATIDDYEFKELGFAIESAFGKDLVSGVIVIRANPSGRPEPGGLSISHEYAIFAKRSADAIIQKMARSKQQDERYTEHDDVGEFEWRNLRREGANSERSRRPKLHYPLYAKGEQVRIPMMEWNGGHTEWIISEEPSKGEVVVWPRDRAGVQRTWRWGIEKVRQNLGIVRCRKTGRTEWQVYFKRRPDPEGITPPTIWTDPKYSATEHGTATLKKLFGVQAFSYPKSPYAVADCIWIAGLSDDESTVIDYFAGSGTTGHAVISLNRQDGGARKYILVEMGEYFDTVLKPRLQKVVFSEDWKDGTPTPQANPTSQRNPYNGVSHCFKVLRLESYEDALDNIEFNHVAAPGEQMDLELPSDYELRYALDWESRECLTRLAVGALDAPFDYTLTLRRETGTVTVRPDLPETFAYLIGLHVRRRFWVEREGVRYLIYTGTLHSDGTETAVLWRNCRGWSEQDLQMEKDWWRQQRETLAPGAMHIYVNAACAIEGHRCLDLEFKSRMHSPATA